MISMEKRIRNLGIIALICIIVPEFISSTILNVVLGAVGTVLGCYLFYALGREYGEEGLFKINILQNVIALPAVAILGYIASNKDALANNVVLYSMYGLMILLLLFLAFTNYKLAKYLTSLSKKTANQYFRFSGLLLVISAYTTPIIIGILFFAVAFVLFLLGCVMFKTPQQNLSEV